MYGREEISIHCPAKVNLLLAVLGGRNDGFHEILSVATPLDFGDRLVLRLLGEEEDDCWSCDCPVLNIGSENLVYKAVESFRAATGLKRSVKVSLEKRIPIGAGLGGGSSDAASTLIGLNRLWGLPLTGQELNDLAATLGSDVPLFPRRAPVIMRGRGECIDVVPDTCLDRILGRRILLFRPEFEISTSVAYGHLAKNAAYFSSGKEMETRLLDWIESDRPINDLLFNSFEKVLFDKYLGIRVLFEKLRTKLGLSCLVSGSGSACFALIDDDATSAVAEQLIRECWGEETFIVESRPLALSN
ncbi:MAG: 4-diphosphocytidyl-2-C-methyl-D-erythritol kinase [Candidatus Moanabacter tarae]|uniref:4-diphosphocytidyl-2-C-methyl-D-erythritol kinase n=1 Tax=Candidatus Moanibacter tarae TaxID=2200854 RepID=A0A2Z4ACZ8_9BACT|nr:MAG: 4-diphosphocytidyl-2-C-methyl-D-erythritol kinase [Candidatus Moanabacter tarae]